MMSRKSRRLLISAAIVGLALGAGQAFTETTTTVEKSVTTGPTDSEVRTTVTTQTSDVVRSETQVETTEKAVIAPGSRVFSLAEFDINGDTILTRREIGDKLFKLYDSDGNDVIDNIEFERRAVLTVVPMEKETIVTYDLDGDGLTDKRQVSYETFMEETVLARFDANRDGLSPREFMDRGFMMADVNNDKVVDMQEWQGSYDARIDAANKAKAAVND